MYHYFIEVTFAECGMHPSQQQVSRKHTFSFLSYHMHWLPVSQRILYRVSALFWRSATGCAPSYLTDLCRPVSDPASRLALRSSARGELLVPRARSALKQRRAFSVIGPSTWNELPLT